MEKVSKGNLSLTCFKTGICEPAAAEDAALSAGGFWGVSDQAEHDVLHPEQDGRPRERRPRQAGVRQPGEDIFSLSLILFNDFFLK